MGARILVIFPTQIDLGPIAFFVSNSVAVATGVGSAGICLTCSIARLRKNRQVQGSQIDLLCKPSYSRFCLKFRRHGNVGHPGGLI